MKVRFKIKTEKFWREHPDSKKLLQSWHKRITVISPKHFVELRNFFQQADRVGNLTVFNIGLDYRLIALIIYKSQEVYIRAVCTHKDYDKGKWKE